MKHKLLIVIALLLVADIIISIYSPESAAVPMILGGVFVAYVIMRKDLLRKHILRGLGNEK